MSISSLFYGLAAYLMMTVVIIATITWQHIWLVIPASVAISWLYDQKETAPNKFRFSYPIAGSALTSILISANPV